VHICAGECREGQGEGLSLYKTKSIGMVMMKDGKMMVMPHGEMTTMKDMKDTEGSMENKTDEM